MTTTQLTNAIATALSHHLPNIPIHPVTGAVPPESQGVTYRLLAAKLTRERSDRFVQSHIYEIRWLDGNNIPEDLPDKLFEALETIEVEGTPYRATELAMENVGRDTETMGVLHDANHQSVGVLRSNANAGTTANCAEVNIAG
ncbi:phage tail terminator family protein [Paenibacillus amylolyticus]|uniref:phage tail terminator family protein n=1 Tax=Paenibacillus amylolyticus TaxID=1451 RepID=UPI003EBEA067